MDATPDPHVPIDERLLDVRTPAELAFSPDGSKVAFALHATVADVGSHPPSDLYLVDRDADTPVQITSGAWSDRSPAWSPDGSRLAFLSDRITPGHQLPYTMVLGAEPVLAATLHGSAEAVSWSGSGDRLLVLAADPGCYGLDWSARAVRGAEPAPDPSVIRPGEARRRLFEIDLASGDVSGGRSAGHERVGVRRGPRRRRGRARLGGSEHRRAGTARSSPGSTSPNAPRRPSTGRPGRSRGSRSRRTGGARPWSRATRATLGC